MSPQSPERCLLSRNSGVTARLTVVMSPRVAQRTRPRTPADGAGRGRVPVSPARAVQEVPGGLSLDASVQEEWHKLSTRLGCACSVCSSAPARHARKIHRQSRCRLYAALLTPLLCTRPLRRYEKLPFHGPTREQFQDMKIADLKQQVQQYKARLAQARSVFPAGSRTEDIGYYSSLRPQCSDLL